MSPASFALEPSNCKIYSLTWSSVTYYIESSSLLLKVILIRFTMASGGGSRINFRVLQNFIKKIENRNDVICRKITDLARSDKVQVCLH